MEDLNDAMYMYMYFHYITSCCNLGIKACAHARTRASTPLPPYTKFVGLLWYLYGRSFLELPQNHHYFFDRTETYVEVQESFLKK